MADVDNTTGPAICGGRGRGALHGKQTVFNLFQLMYIFYPLISALFLPIVYNIFRCGSPQLCGFAPASHPAAPGPGT